MYYSTRHIPLDELQVMLDEVSGWVDEVKLQRPTVNLQWLLRNLIIYRVGMDKVARINIIVKWIDTGYFPYGYFEQTVIRRIAYSNGFVERNGIRIHPKLPSFPFSLNACINDVQFEWINQYMETIK